MRGGSVLALVALLVLLQGCSLGPKAPHREIDVIGVVAQVQSSFDGPDTVERFTFDDSRTYEMRYGGHLTVGGPQVGDLLIAGTRPDNWMLVATAATPEDTASGYPPGCYGLGTHAGYDTETTVELDFGVTLQKAPDFNPTGHGTPGRFSGRGVICLDRQGRVTLINA